MLRLIVILLLMIFPVMAHGHKLDTYKYNCFEARYFDTSEVTPVGMIPSSAELAPHEGNCRIDYQQVPGTKGNELYFIRYKEFLKKKWTSDEERPTGAVAIFKNNGELIFAGNEYGDDAYFENVEMVNNSYGKFLVLTARIPDAEVPREPYIYKLEGSKVINVDSTVLYSGDAGINLPDGAKVLIGAKFDLKKMEQDLPVWRRGEPDYTTLEVKYKYQDGKLLVDSYIYKPDKKFLGSF